MLWVLATAATTTTSLTNLGRRRWRLAVAARNGGLSPFADGLGPGHAGHVDVIVAVGAVVVIGAGAELASMLALVGGRLSCEGYGEQAGHDEERDLETHVAR